MSLHIHRFCAQKLLLQLCIQNLPKDVVSNLHHKDECNSIQEQVHPIRVSHQEAYAYPDQHDHHDEAENCNGCYYASVLERYALDCVGGLVMRFLLNHLSPIKVVCIREVRNIRPGRENVLEFGIHRKEEQTNDNTLVHAEQGVVGCPYIRLGSIV